ncbi:MAG: periplasmic heavy metal sensor [Ignavibacteriota bacterium]
MDIFSQKKLLVRIIVLLVALNLISIGIFLWKEFSRKPPLHPPVQTQDNDKEDLTPILKRELNLTEEQSEKMKEVRSNYPKKEKAIREILNKERDSLNAEAFKKNPDEELIKSLARRISDSEYQVELLRYEQAKELKAICTPEQREKFEDLVKEIRDYLRGKPKQK